MSARNRALLLAWSVAGVTALSLSYDLMRKPIQVSDSLAELMDVQESPSLYATFVATAQRSAYLRPMRLVQIKALFDLANGQLRLAYTGFHALLLTAAILLFMHALRVETWADCAAGVFALTVLTGLHTFSGTLREAFPINHFLEIVVFCLMALAFAQSRGGRLVDVAANVVFVVAVLTLESGLLVWVIVVAAQASGMRGISRRGVVTMTLLLFGYFVLRFGFLSVGTPGLEERSSGFLVTMLEPDEIRARFGDNPIPFYIYNVATSVMSVLLSEPDGGIFEIPRGWLQDDLPPRVFLRVASSVMTTGLIAWFLVARLRRRAADSLGRDEQLLIVAGVVLVANAALSYAYTKHEIISVAGVFYALGAFVAARGALEHLRMRPRGAASVIAVAMMVVMASLWAFRSAGVHHMLRQQAFKQRNDWAYVNQSFDGSPEGRRAEALVRQLRSGAFELRVTNPNMLPSWMDRWWGE